MRQILSVFVALLLAAMSLVPAASAIEVPLGAWQPLPGRDAAWRLLEQQRSQWLEVTDDNGAPAGRYELGHCRFCAGEDDGCDDTGIFPVLVPTRQLPVLGAVCLIGAHSMEGWIFDPAADPVAPAFTVTGAYVVRARVEPGRIVFQHDDIVDGTPRQSFAAWPADATPPPAAPPARLVTVPPPETPLPADAAAALVRFRAVVEARDRDGLLALASDDILVSLGGHAGRADLAGYWELESDPDASPLWPALDRLLAQPAAMSPWDGPPALLVPYYLAAWPNDLDGFGWLIARGPAVALRVGPATTAPLLGRLNHAAVQVPYDLMPDDVASDGWRLVRYGGQYGYVANDDVDSPIGLRAALERRDGRWQLIRLFAGD